jgi:hypothetical protein
MRIHKLVVQRRLVILVFLKDCKTHEWHSFVLNVVRKAKFFSLFFVLGVVEQVLSVLCGRSI